MPSPFSRFPLSKFESGCLIVAGLALIGQLILGQQLSSFQPEAVITLDEKGSRVVEVTGPPTWWTITASALQASSLVTALLALGSWLRRQLRRTPGSGTVPPGS